MADVDEMVLATVRRHIADRRQAIAAKFPKNLTPEEYQKQIGRYEELEALAAVVQDAVRRANAQELGAPDDDDPETA
jgi:hypothetical protein